MERAAIRRGWGFDLLPGFESTVLSEFQRRANHCLPSLPETGATIEWLALLQHHGAPTRLVDFTESFYIAAFFACEFATDDAAIWAVNAPKLRLKLAAKMGIESTDPLMAQLEVSLKAVEFCEAALQSESPEALAVPIQPWTLNQRISLQKGLFLCPLDLTRSFEENLAGTLAVRPEAFRKLPVMPLGRVSSPAKFEIVKFVIPKSRLLRVQTDLERMNISAATLFPGLDGFARSLHSRIGFESIYDSVEDD